MKLGLTMDLGGVRLRGYRAGDLEAICRLDEVCFAKAFRFDRESMRRFAERRGAIVVVAEAGPDGEVGICGFLIVHLEGSGRAVRGYVVTLDVAAAWRRRGLAKTMMAEAESKAREVGAVAMELHVYTGNESAVRFYEGRRYLRVGMGKGFYGVGADAFVYRKVLEEG